MVLSALAYWVNREHGIEPAPRRGMSWKTFLKAHWDVIAAADMFRVELWLGRSLVRYHVLFAIELATPYGVFNRPNPHAASRW
ncbi:MAG: hypothetical protein ACI9NC_005296 [Verrucomicrobiales bacterium]|jgi:hypothetical protein